LQKKRPDVRRNRERRLLIPQIAQVDGMTYPRIVEPDIRLLRATHPIDPRRLVPDGNSWLRVRHRFPDGTEKRTLVGIEHAARIEFDHDRQHVVVLKQVGNFSHERDVPREIERVGPQTREHAKDAVRGRCAPLVIDDH
jgi:hypothetical protein